MKLLKVLVEESQLVYKWEYGESVVKVRCSGVVAKAVSIIKPTFHLKDEKVNLEQMPKLTEEELWMLRGYLAKCRALLENMQILEEDSKKIE